jgi:hypothetical protein
MKITVHLVLLRHQQHRKAGIDEFAAEVAKDVQRQFQEIVGTPVQFSLRAPQFAEYRKRDREFSAAPRLWLDFTIKSRAAFDIHEFERDSSDETSKRESSALVWRCVEAMETCLPNCILAANIAKPGVISMMGGFLTVDGHSIISAPILENFLLEHLDFARALGWPREIEVSYSDALKWVDKILENQPLVASTPIGRALAAFSQVAASEKHHGNHLQLFWAMMALEALYCEGTEALKRQLFEKAAIIFGPLTDNKKRIRSLYDFRSAFVHGSLEMPYSFTFYHEDTAVDSFHDDLHEAESISYLLLIASLQFLVRNDRTDLNFKYHLE